MSHKAWAWFEANRKQTLYGGGAVLLVSLIVAYFLYRHNAQEVAASEALSKVTVPQMIGSGSRTGVAEAYLKVADTYPKSGAGARALLLAAGDFYTEGKYDLAKAQFDRFRREHSKSPFIGQALLGLAACLDAQGKAREAMTAYQDVITRRPGENVVSQARFALARLHEAQNEPEKARNLYEEVERTDPYGPLGPEAGMRLEELKVKYPKLFAVPAPVVVAPPPTNTAPATTNAAPLRIVTPK